MIGIPDSVRVSELPSELAIAYLFGRCLRLLPRRCLPYSFPIAPKVAGVDAQASEAGEVPEAQMAIILSTPSSFTIEEANALSGNWPLHVLGNLSEVAQAVLEDASGFADLLCMLTKACNSVICSSRGRLSEGASQDVLPTIDCGSLLTELQRNDGHMQQVHSYVQQLFLVAGLARADDFLSKDGYAESLLIFARLHLSAEAGSLAGFECGSMFANGSFLKVLGGRIDKLVRTIGRDCYRVHTGVFCSEMVKKIVSAAPEFELCSLHSKALDAKEIQDILPALLRGCKFEAMAKDVRLPLEGDLDKDMEVLRELGHNVTLKILENFCIEARIGSLCIPKVVRPSEEEAIGMPTPLVMTVLASLTQTSDIVMVAVTIQKFVVPLVCKPDPTSQDELLQYAAYALALLQKLLTTFDALLHDDLSMKLEEECYQLPIALATLRSWRGSMAAFAGKLQAHVLQAYMVLLDHQIAACKSITPSWQVAFQGGPNSDQFDLELAGKVLAGRLQAVVRGHNELHALVQVVFVRVVSLGGPLRNLRPPNMNASILGTV